MIVRYERTADPDVFKRIETEEMPIHLSELQREIQDLEVRMSEPPLIKTEPDQETLDFWNAQHPVIDTTALKHRKDGLEQLAQELRSLPMLERDQE